MEVKIKKLSNLAVIPTKGTNTSAAYDLTATRITTEINECGELILVYHTDLAFEIPEGHAGFLFMRSSIAKKSMSMCNAVGIIDSDFRGEVTGKFRTTVPVVPAVIQTGERAMQIIILPIPTVDFIESDTLTETERGDGGYGSTDKKTLNDNISAPTEPAGYPEQKSELTDQEAANDGSGGEVNIPEQA